MHTSLRNASTIFSGAVIRDRALYMSFDTNLIYANHAVFTAVLIFIGFATFTKISLDKSIANSGLMRVLALYVIHFAV